MKLLLENWRKHVEEVEALEEKRSRATKVAQRAKIIINLIIKRLKSHMADYPDDAMAVTMFNWSTKYDHLKLLDREVYSSEGAFHEPGKEDRHLRVDFQVRASGGIVTKFTIGGAYGALKPKKGYEKEFQAAGLDKVDTLTGELVFKYKLTKKEIIQNLENIYMSLVNWAAHELEHQQQYYRGEVGTDEEYIPASSTNLMKYLLQDVEIEAFARGFYTKSVKLKIPFEEIVQSERDQLFKFAKTRKDSSWLAWFVFKKVTKKDMDRWVKAIFDYASVNLPCAQRIDGSPINPDLCRR